MKFKYVKSSLIEIESELNNKNTKETVKDFTKLMCGNSPLKIMIISKYENYNNKIIDILGKVALKSRACENQNERLILVVIDHPKEWDCENIEGAYYQKYYYNNGMFSKEIVVKSIQ